MEGIICRVQHPLFKLRDGTFRGLEVLISNSSILKLLTGILKFLQ